MASGGGVAVNVPGPVTSQESQASRPVFISYASANQKKALDLCAALEARGIQCWLSCRDIAPGQNYQESIVGAIHGARAMLLQFSEAANSSDEIKKELSLASRFRVPVIAVRIEDVVPTNAFAYELSTRQWIDAFHGWDRVADELVRSIDDASRRKVASVHMPETRARARRHTTIAAGALGLVMLAGGTAWYLLTPSNVAAHSMQIRLTGFDRLSADLPPSLPNALKDEVTPAFGTEGQITVSTASAPPPGSAPAYALGGAFRRDGDKVRAVARVTNERTGATLWSYEFNYPGKTMEKLPRWFALDTTSVVRCALFDASTYPKPLADTVLRDLFSFCGADSPSQGVDFAKRVVEAAPDFSAVWSGMANRMIGQTARSPASDRKALENAALDAANRAIKLDPKNAEAYAMKTFLVPGADLAQREALFRKALDARPLACGCEHHFYARFLSEIGRMHDAERQYSRALDFLPLAAEINIETGETILALGRSRDEAQRHFNVAADAVPDAEFLDDTKLEEAPISGDYRAAIEVLRSGREPGIPPKYQGALVAADQAMISQNPQAKSAAVKLLLALPEEFQGRLSVLLLGALGANGAALHQLEAIDLSGNSAKARTWLWYPSMAGALRDPSFPAVARRLGLMTYWTTKHVKPDVCSAKGSPLFCRLL